MLVQKKNYNFAEVCLLTPLGNTAWTLVNRWNLRDVICECSLNNFWMISHPSDVFFSFSGRQRFSSGSVQGQKGEAKSLDIFHFLQIDIYKFVCSKNEMDQ